MVFQAMKKGGKKNKILIGHGRQESDSEGTCSGALATTLRVSRLVGVAPLRMEQRQSRWNIRFSRAFAWYSYIFIIALDVCLILGAMMDFYIPKNKAVKARTVTSRAAWYLDIQFVTSISGYGVFTAPKRMKSIFESLNLLDSILKEVRGYTKSPPKETKKVVLLVLLILFAFVINYGDFICFVVEAILNDKDLKVALMYICYYIEAFLSSMLSLQFVVVGLMVDTALKSINCEIERIIKSCDLQGTADKPYSLLRGKYFSTAIPVPKLQSIVDVMLVKNSKVHSTEIATRLRSLAHAYAITCKLLKEIDNCFGVITVLSLASVFFQLIVAPYSLACFALSKRPDKVHILFEIGYLIFHFINLCLLTEPGSRIKNEMMRTEMLLSQMLRRITPEDHSFEDLEYFYQQVMMYQPEFSALGIGNMRRPFITAVMAGVSNYIIIVVQLEVSDINNW
ncbi:hypothetical protein O0L34_g15114 [Tuta absoluta]|nr:hypothetical protein O0L34_g15114 [Tuta absoluta]